MTKQELIDLIEPLIKKKLMGTKFYGCVITDVRVVLKVETEYCECRRDECDGCAFSYNDFKIQCKIKTDSGKDSDWTEYHVNGLKW